MRAIIICGLVLALVAACGDTQRPLRDMRAAGGGPDEFAVIPVASLEIPQQLTLPVPTPNGTNRADPQPKANAIMALGGSSSAQFAGGVPAIDGGLVAQANRYGTDPDIRATLAVADERFLQRKRRTNIFNPLNRDRYFPAYAGQVLDPYAELIRLRELGVQVPTLPISQQEQVAANVEQKCVFRTVPPDNTLRRVCTPVDNSEQ